MKKEKGNLETTLKVIGGVKGKIQPQYTQKEWKLIGDGGSGSLIGIPNDTGTYDYIAEITSFDKTHAHRIVKCVNNERKINMHDELVKQLQEMIRYSKVLAKNSHATQHLPIQEAEQLLKQAEQK